MNNLDQEAKQIKNAIIDLLHFNEAVSLETIAEKSGLKLTRVKEHRRSIDAMLDKLKRLRTEVTFKD